MKYTKFTKLKIKNFLSVGEEMITIEFQEKGDGRINVITGENLDKKGSSNGIGKSTIIEAFYYALYGKTIRDIKQAFISNNVTKKPAEVSIEFEIDSKKYRIERQIKPTKVNVFIDEKDETSSTIATNGAFIQDLLGYGPEVFEYCVIMTMQNSAIFMQAKASDKRKIIEQNLNLNKFAEMLKTINLELTEFKKKQLQLLSTVNTSEQFIEESKKTLLQLKHSREKQHEEMSDKKLKIQSNIDNLLIEKTSIENKIKVLEDKLVGDDIDLITVNKQKNKVFDLERELENSNEEFKKIVTNTVNLKNRTGVCLSCKRAYSEHDNELIEKEISESKIICINLKQKISDLKIKIETSKNVLERFDTKFDARNVSKNQLDNEKYLLRNNERAIKMYEEQLNDIRPNMLFDQNIKDLASELKTNMVQLDKSKKLLEEVNIEINVCDKAKFILGDDGIKTVLIERVIDVFNTLINKYLNDFESHYYIQFDKYFESTITSLSNIEVSYDNLSGAERKYIDIAIMLAFADLKKLQSNVETNVLIFDELLDSAVDSAGINNIIESLKKRSENIYIISHRKECRTIADDTGGECVYLVKENGVTRKVG